MLRKSKENNQIFEVKNSRRKSKKNAINEAFFKNRYLAPVSNSNDFQNSYIKSIDLVKSEDEFEYYLDIDQPPVFCLLKSEQFLKKLNSNLDPLNGECLALDTQKPLVILKYKKKFMHQNKGLKKELLDELEQFLKDNFKSQVFRTTKALRDDEFLHNKFNDFLKSTKQSQTNGYTLIKDDFIYCYGTEKFVDKKFKQLNKFLNRILNKNENKSRLVTDNFSKNQTQNEVSCFDAYLSFFFNFFRVKV